MQIATKQILGVLSGMQVIVWATSFVCCQEHDVPWHGEGQYRILVKVEPTAETTGDRDRDEMVARCRIDFHQLHPGLPIDQHVDLGSLQVIEYAPATGEALPFDRNDCQRSPADRPFRFYDASLLDAFPTWRKYASLEAQRGRPLSGQETLPFGHRVFNAVGEGRRGTLVWSHTQRSHRDSYYAIYFDLLPAGRIALSPPCGFVGDGSNRIVQRSTQSGPPGNNAGCATDLNNDGRVDLLYGTSSGYLVLAENTSQHATTGGRPGATAASPQLARRRILFDVHDKPIDVGYDSYPHVVDFNGDGRQDLLVGAEKGCIFYFRNQGSQAAPRWQLAGLLQADGELLLTPNWPIAELADEPRGSVFAADYVAIPHAVDWDGDEDLDLLVGGFVTGQVFYFENVGRQEDGTPNLESRGPLLSDGRPLDTAWAAAPAAADFDHDGDLDLVCGAKPMTRTGGDKSDPSRNLFYFENVGSRRAAELLQREFPRSQKSPIGSTLMPSAVDFNHDGLLDLVLVARSMQTYFVPNVGSPTDPQFDLNVPPTNGHWTNQQLSSGTFLDWNGDGYPDIITRFSVLLNSGRRMPGFFEQRVNLLAGSDPIRHATPYGDENAGVVCFDFDRDGDHDCIYGAHSGYIWFHENRGSNDRPLWDTKGYRFELAEGGFVKVGMTDESTPESFNFTVLQGARAKPAPADFNGDGLTDLVIGDTYGKVRYFENVGTNLAPKFAQPVVVFQHGNRLNVMATDWNLDERPDLMVIIGNGIYLLENRASGGRCEFHQPRRLELPGTIGNITSVAPVDYNQDGDVDILFNTSHRMTCFVERSFLDAGYRDATVIRSQP